jgi:hypothetical protein
MRMRTSACLEKREESLLKSEERETPMVESGDGQSVACQLRPKDELSRHHGHQVPASRAHRVTSPRPLGSDRARPALDYTCPC